MKTSNLFTTLSAWVLGVFLCMGSVTAVAVDDLGIFELEGNAVEDGMMQPPDDWETLCVPVMGECTNPGPGPGDGSSEVFTGINVDPDLTSIFTGGRKDIQDIPDWAHKDGSVPDKDDITNAYAAAYLNTTPTMEQDVGDLIIYFGSDRIDQNGDAFMGYWFFQDNVQAVTEGELAGEFIGEHIAGDILVITNYPQSNNAVPLIKVIEWDPTCSKAANNDPQNGECAAKNLRLIESAEGDDALCDPNGVDQLACAISNTEADSGGVNDPTPSPWPYVSKDGDVNQFPGETFLEGGINVTQLLDETTGCFSSFMAETRSSSSFTASLKDFRLDKFQLCTADAVTEIHDAAHMQIDENDTGMPVAGDPVVGDTIHDSVLITGTALGADAPDPTSPPDVTFVLFDNLTCTPDGDVDSNGIPVGGESDANVLDVTTGSLMGNMDGTATAESGDFILTQTGAHGYQAFWPGNDDYPAGAVSACEPFNVIQPKVRVRKEILSCGDADAGSFAYTNDASLTIANLGDTITLGSDLTDGDGSGPHSVPPGMIKIEETLQTAYEYVYPGSMVSDCADTSDMTNPGEQTAAVANNDDKTCVYFNVRKPQVTVTKVIDGSGTFDLEVDGNKVNTDAMNPLTGSTLISGFSSGNFGTVTVGETSADMALPLENYSTVINCDDGTIEAWEPDEVTSGSAADDSGVREVTISTLFPGVHVTCEITNVQILEAPACLSPSSP